MMKMWAIHNKDSFEQVYSETKPKGSKVVELDRFGDLMVEYHDIKQGWLPRDAEHLKGVIDLGFDLDNPQHRLIDYAIKEIEARIINGTLATEGRLAREAAVRGVTVTDLAAQVVEKADSDTRDLQRIRAKKDLDK